MPYDFHLTADSSMLYIEHVDKEFPRHVSFTWGIDRKELLKLVKKAHRNKSGYSRMGPIEVSNVTIKPRQ